MIKNDVERKQGRRKRRKEGKSAAQGERSMLESERRRLGDDWQEERRMITTSLVQGPQN
jgi:hypothetical protein